MSVETPSSWFVIYGRNNCSYCETAKKHLTRKGYDFIFFNIEEDPIAMKKFKEEFPTVKTVPQIIQYSKVSRHVIGGYAELVEHLKNK